MKGSPTRQRGTNHLTPRLNVGRLVSSLTRRATSNGSQWSRSHNDCPGGMEVSSLHGIHTQNLNSHAKSEFPSNKSKGKAFHNAKRKTSDLSLKTPVRRCVWRCGLATPLNCCQSSYRCLQPPPKVHPKGTEISAVNVTIAIEIKCRVVTRT